MSRRFVYALVLVIVLLACGVAWYWFRPEKAFINNTVNEPPPPGVPADTSSAPNSADSPQQR
jgi:hypothetical protein